MIPFPLLDGSRLRRVLCLGAHSDDIEIGAGGTILQWLDQGMPLEIHWAVLGASGARAQEARASAEAFLRGADATIIDVAAFTDTLFPAELREIRSWMLSLRARCSPDLILTHRRDDAHQDHRVVSELTWNLFRDHLILEYEVPKWDGDMGRPNLYAPLRAEIVERKIGMLDEHFGSQRSKDWFDAETFRGLARLRGMECRAPEGRAEAFHMRKGVIG